MSTTDVTALLVLCVPAGVSAYTAWRAANDVPGDTVSEVVRAWATRGPAVPMAIGVLAGHWLAPPVDSPAWGPWALAALGLAALVQAAWRPVRMSRWHALASLGAGALAGGMLWSMT